MVRHIEHINLDMDGVLVDFVSPSIAIHGRYDLLKDPNFPSEYDYWPQMGLTGAEFWKVIRDAGPNWWLTLPVYPWAKDLMDLCTEYDPAWSVATKPVDAPGCAAKWDWRATHCPKQTLHITTNKLELCKPGHVLIDDADGNIEAWNAAGGFGVLFPATWNKNRVFVGREMAYVSQQLRHYSERKAA